MACWVSGGGCHWPVTWPQDCLQTWQGYKGTQVSYWLAGNSTGALLLSPSLQGYCRTAAEKHWCSCGSKLVAQCHHPWFPAKNMIYKFSLDLKIEFALCLNQRMWTRRWTLLIVGIHSRNTKLISWLIYSKKWDNFSVSWTIRPSVSYYTVVLVFFFCDHLALYPWGHNLISKIIHDIVILLLEHLRYWPPKSIMIQGGADFITLR